VTTPAELADTPVVDASEHVADATATRPAQSVPKPPPPAGLLEGEQRADDGILPVITD
jgi:hypothetical protein